MHQAINLKYTKPSPGYYESGDLVTQTYPSLGYCVLGDPDIPKQEELGLRLPGHHGVMPLDHRRLQVHAHFTQAVTQTHGSQIHYSNLNNNSCMEWVDLGPSYIDFGLG